MSKQARRELLYFIANPSLKEPMLEVEEEDYPEYKPPTKEAMREYYRLLREYHARKSHNSKKI